MIISPKSQRTFFACLYSLSLPLKNYALLALYGTNGLTPEHLQAIKKLKKLEEIIYALDADEAGQQAMETCGGCLAEALPLVRQSYLPLPLGEDVNSLAVAHHNYPELFNQLFNQRENLIKLKLEKTEPPQLDTTNPLYISLIYPPLKFTLLGGFKIQQLDRLRVTLLTELQPLLSPLHTFRQSIDLFNDELTQKLIAKIAQRLELPTPLVQLRIAFLIQALAHYQQREVAAKTKAKPKKRLLNLEQIKKAKEYLEAPDLLQRTSADIAKTGIVGEQQNRLLMYLCFTSRLRSSPLHIVTLGGSGTGKTYLQEKVASLFPEEDVIQITASTDNAFYYIEDGDLRHKIILIEDLEGAESVMYILRELMSKKMVSKLVTQKTAKGDLKTVRVCVHGPICLAATSTQEVLYEDNANRSFVVSPDNSPQQINDILEWQRKGSAGLIDQVAEESLRAFFKDLQSVLLPMEVRNPYAESLRLPPLCFKPLRTQAQYLSFIETITFYHQFQRTPLVDKNTGAKYIHTTIQDIEQANDLLLDVLLRKSDELKSKVCRDFLLDLRKYIQTHKLSTFKAHDLRQTLRIHPSKVKRHLAELLRFGYLKVVGGNRYNGGLEYQLAAPEDYQVLKEQIKSILDKQVLQLKNRKV